MSEEDSRLKPVATYKLRDSDHLNKVIRKFNKERMRKVIAVIEDERNESGRGTVEKSN